MEINNIEIIEATVVSARDTELYNLIDSIISEVNDEEDYDLIQENPDNFDVNLETIGKLEEIKDESSVDLNDLIYFLSSLHEKGFNYINIYKG